MAGKAPSPQASTPSATNPFRTSRPWKRGRRTSSFSEVGRTGSCSRPCQVCTNKLWCRCTFVTTVGKRVAEYFETGGSAVHLRRGHHDFKRDKGIGRQCTGAAAPGVARRTQGAKVPWLCATSLRPIDLKEGPPPPCHHSEKNSRATVPQAGGERGP